MVPQTLLWIIRSSDQQISTSPVRPVELRQTWEEGLWILGFEKLFTLDPAASVYQQSSMNKGCRRGEQERWVSLLDIWKADERRIQRSSCTYSSDLVCACGSAAPSWWCELFSISGFSFIVKDWTEQKDDASVNSCFLSTHARWNTFSCTETCRGFMMKGSVTSSSLEEKLYQHVIMNPGICKIHIKRLGEDNKSVPSCWESDGGSVRSLSLIMLLSSSSSWDEHGFGSVYICSSFHRHGH